MLMEKEATILKNKVSLEKADVILDDNYLVRIHIKENSDIETEDIERIQVAKRKLIGQNPHLVIFVPPKFGNISKEARELSASKEVCRNAIAKAIIVKTVSAKLIGNVFLKINKPPVPVKLFKDEKDAEKWLREMQNN
jgi:hypothetical protein